MFQKSSRTFDSSLDAQEAECGVQFQRDDSQMKKLEKAVFKQ